MKSVIKRNTDYEVKIIEGSRWIIFYFNDGKMTGTKQSTPYTKSRKDWEFYGKAIKRMLKESREFYPEQEEMQLENDVSPDDIPF